MGIIDYTTQKENPRIKFLQNRVNTSDLVINQKNILRRKLAFEKRLHAIIGYIRDQHTCRSKMIAAYFNDLDIERCGICDNCLHERNIIITKEEFKEIREGITGLVSVKPANSKQIIHKMRGFKQNKILKILHFLQEENIISITEDGFIKMKNE